MITPVKIRVLQLGTVSLLACGLLGCGKLTQSEVNVFGSNMSVTNIGDIQNNGNARSPVYLKGKVATVAPFLGNGAYELQDDTGSIWVITDKIPSRGDEVLIKSQVQYQSIPVGGKDLGEVYVQEQEQLERKQAEKKR